MCKCDNDELINALCCCVADLKQLNDLNKSNIDLILDVISCMRGNINNLQKRIEVLENDRTTNNRCFSKV